METTFNVHTSILDKISMAAQVKKITRSEMILILLKTAMDDIPDPGQIGTMVRYQRKCSPEEWHKFHISLRMDDYEFFLDLRKLLKMSVSYILAYAVKKYLDSILRSNITDNYQHRNYVLIKDVIDHIICWKILWGYPYNLAKFIPQNTIPL